MIAKEKLLVAQDKGQKQQKKAAKNQTSAQVAARLDQVISSPSVKKALDTKSATVASRLDTGTYAANTGTQKKLVEQEKNRKSTEEVHRPGNLAEGFHKTRSYASDYVMMETIERAYARWALQQDNTAAQKEREAIKKSAEHQKAAMERMRDDLYRQMEGYKNNGQTNELFKAEQQYAKLNENISHMNSKIHRSAVEEAAEWESRRYNEIMATGGYSLMAKMEKLAGLYDKCVRGGAYGERKNGLTETEKQYYELYNSLTAEHGSKVDDWLAYAKRIDNRSRVSMATAKARQAAEDNSFWSSVGSIPLNIISGIGYLDAAGQKLQRAVIGSDVPIDYNSPAQIPSKMANTIRGTVSEDMSGVGRLLYHTGMSMADTLAAMPLGGVGMATLGGSAATNAMQAAVDRGASDDQALWIGAVAGTLETVMEKLSIESLFKLKDAKTAAEFFLNMLKQSNAGGSEEGLTRLANDFADYVIMGDKSELNAAKRAYMAQGYSADKAEGMALKDWGIGLLLDVAGGMMSGGAFGSAKTAVNTYGNRNTVDVRSGMTYDVIREDPDFDRQFMDGFNAEEELHDGEERLYLRNSGQWDGGPDSGGSISTVETGSGRDQGRQAETAATDGGTAALSYGQKVSAASLGIPGGSTEANIQIVTGGETAATRAAIKTAKDNGLQLTLFSGGNLQITNESGKTDSVRGYISGDKVFVRADHPAYTADQIMRHEAGHARIARGEIDVRQIRERIREKYGVKRTNKLSELYTAAYEGSGLNADEIWEEVVCDSLGDMNIFRELRAEGAVGSMLRTVKESAETETRMTRGPPAEGTSIPGRMSRESGYKKVNKQAWRQIQRERMSRYGGKFDTMPKMDTFYAYDMLFVLENYDETSFGVVEAVDPAKHQEKANLVLEVMKDGNIEYPSEYRRRIENLRSWKRRHASDSVLAGNTRTGAEDAGTSSQHGNTRNRVAVAEKSSGVDDSELRLGQETEIKRNLQPEGVGYTKNIEFLQQMETLQALYRKVQEDEELEKAFLQGFNLEE